MKIFNKRIATVAMTAALALGFILPANSMARGDKDGLPGWTRQLNDGQRATVKKILDKGAGERRAAREAVKAKENELREALSQASPDRARIQNLALEIGELRGKEMVARVEARQKMQKEGIPVELMAARNKKKGKFNKAPGLTPPLNDALTAEQRATAEKIIAENASTLEATQKAIAEKRGALKQAMDAANPDLAAIAGLSRELGELRGQQLLDKLDLRAHFAKAGLPDKVFGKGGKKGGHDGPRKSRDGKKGKHRGDRGERD